MGIKKTFHDRKAPSRSDVVLQGYEKMDLHKVFKYLSQDFGRESSPVIIRDSDADGLVSFKDKNGKVKVGIPHSLFLEYCSAHEHAGSHLDGNNNPQIGRHLSFSDNIKEKIRENAQWRWNMAIRERVDTICTSLKKANRTEEEATFNNTFLSFRNSDNDISSFVNGVLMGVNSYLDSHKKKVTYSSDETADSSE